MKPDWGKAIFLFFYLSNTQNTHTNTDYDTETNTKTERETNTHNTSEFFLEKCKISPNVFKFDSFYLSNTRIHTMTHKQIERDTHMSKRKNREMQAQSKCT